MQRVAGEEDIAPRMTDRARRTLTGGDWVVVTGAAVVLLSLLLPWWDDGFDRTANGFHDWGWLSFLSLVLLATLFCVRSFLPELRGVPELSVSDPAAYVIGGIAEVVGAVVFWLAGNSKLIGQVRYGVFVCVVGGAVTAAGGYLKHLERQPAPPPASTPPVTE